MGQGNYCGSWRKPCWSLLGLFAIGVLTGCLAAGVPYTSDPRQKLSYAYQLMNLNRPLPAEKLINEALETFQKQGNEIWIAECYFTFGNLYKHSSYHNWKNYYSSRGEYDGTYSRSKDYFQNATDLYLKNNDLVGASKATFGIGIVHGLQGNPISECHFFDESARLFAEAKAKDAAAMVRVLVPGIKDFPEMVAAFKRDRGCA